MAKVLIAGATGYIGSHIAEQLGKANVKTSALVRNASDGSNPARVATLAKLKAAGVTIVEGSTSASTDELASILKDFDTVVSAISGPDLESGQLALIEAAKKAGTIKRFIPSEYGNDYNLAEEDIAPALRDFLSAKQAAQDALKEAGIDYTLVISSGFFGYLLPQLGQLGPPPVPQTVSVYAGGNTRAAATDEDDVGRVVAHAVNDPRTANKKLVIKANMFTQNELIATWERLSGKTITKQPVSPEDLEAQIKGAEGQDAIFLGLIKLIWVDGSNDKPVANSVSATELYPDLNFKTVEEFLKQLV